MPNRYRIARRLRPGPREIYEAYVVGEQGFERRVALKPLSWASGDPDFIASFVEDIRTAGRLDHANILSVVDFGLMDDVPFVVSEYFEGLELDTLIEHLRQRRLTVPPEVALYIVSEAGRGLAHAHELTDALDQPLVHRGVSPTTVSVGWTGEVKVVDFGLARAASRLEQTTHGLMPVHLGYLAPEQAFDVEVGPSTDQFSLACVLHGLLAGQSPMDDGRVREQALTGSDPELSPALPVDIARIIRRATLVQPTDRFVSMSAFTDACMAALGHRVRRDPRQNLRDYLRTEGPPRPYQNPPMQPEREVVLTADHLGSLRRFASVPPGPTPEVPAEAPAQGDWGEPSNDVGPAWHDAPDPRTTARSELPPEMDDPEPVSADEPVTALVEPSLDLMPGASLNEPTGITVAAPTPSEPDFGEPAPPLVAPAHDASGSPGAMSGEDAAEDEEDDPLLGQVLHGYRIEMALGSGALARVYRARHLVLDHLYAVKVLYGAAATNERAKERLRREAQALSRLRHPNIVSVVDFGMTPKGFPFLTMELLEGRTLRQIIRNESPVPAPRVANIALQISDALSFAHELGVVHRDVKPSNIMVDDNDRVKVLDFGIARFRAAEGTRLTATDALLGTPRYMAPEQITGASEVGPAADLYALGVMMYAMLSGEPPFVGTTLEVVERQLNEAPRPLASRTGLEPLVMQLLSKQPELRPAGAAAVIGAIDRLDLLTEPTENPPIRATAVAAAPRPPPAMPPTGVHAPALPAFSVAAGAPTTIGEAPPPEAPRWPLLLALTAAVAVGSAVITAAILTRSEPAARLRTPAAVRPAEPAPPPLVPAPQRPAVHARAQPAAANVAALKSAGPARASESVDAGFPKKRRGPARRTDTAGAKRDGAQRLKAAHRQLRRLGLTRADLRDDPELKESWRNLERAARSGNPSRIQRAEADLRAASTRALTADRVKRRLDAFAGRLREAASTMAADRLAALEDRYLDLRSTAPQVDNPQTNAATLRRLANLELELRKARKRPAGGNQDRQTP